MGYPARYPKQPWTYDTRDLVPMGDPETSIYLPQGESIEGLHIVGLEADVMLGIRCDAHGHPLSCAVANEIIIEHVPVQSNPRRHLDDENVYRDHGEA